jgi:hypothetical protein
MKPANCSASGSRMASRISWDTGGVWHPEGILPGQGTKFSQLAAGVGWGIQSGGGLGVATRYNRYLQVIGLGANDGFAYLAAFEDVVGTWHSGGILPGQTIPFSQLSVVVGNNNQLQVIGRAVSDGRLYLTAFQDTNGIWHATGLLPGQSPGFSSITTDNGNGNGSTGRVQVFGLGASDGYLYLPDWQDDDGNWFAAGILPSQCRRFEQMATTRVLQGNENDGWYYILVVGGLGASDHILYITDWQDTVGTWHAYGSIPTLQVPLKQVVAADGGFYGIGEADDHIYLLTYVDTDGTWHSGFDMTEAESAPPAAPVLSSNSTSVQSGYPFTISWSVPPGSLNHYTFSISENGGTATTTTFGFSTTSQTYTETAGPRVTNVFDFQIRACSSSDESSCSVWSNTVAVNVDDGIGGGGGCARCR